jgi:hypothetical protein
VPLAYVLGVNTENGRSANNPLVSADPSAGAAVPAGSVLAGSLAAGAPLVGTVVARGPLVGAAPEVVAALSPAEVGVGCVATAVDPPVVVAPPEAVDDEAQAQRPTERKNAVK